MSTTKSGKRFTTEELRNFYFSKATNYAAYATKKGDSHQHTAIERVTTPSDIDISIGSAAAGSVKKIPSPVSVKATSPAQVFQPEEQTQETLQKPALRGAAGSAVAVAKASSAGHSAESVSPEYITFLRQQQDLVKAHCGVDELLQQFVNVATERREDHQARVNSANTLLVEAENSTNWNWKSKFNRDGLAHDAGLCVPFSELRFADDIPNITDLQHQHQQLVKLKQSASKNGEEAHSEFDLTLKNGIRRFERLIKEFSASQLDATDVVRLSDNLVVQLDHVLNQPPLHQVLMDINDTLVVVSEKQKECMGMRDQAHEDGEMHIAERETYRLVDLSEELANAQVEKIELLSRAKEDNTVGLAIRESYSQKALDDAKKLEDETNDLKSRCEADLAKLYALKQQVDTAEQHMQEKWDNDRSASDQKLRDIATRQSEAWDQIVSLLKQIRQLEAERHAEIKLRVEEKVKDESRRNEYLMFSNVSNEHAANLDRTIKNCDTNMHCSKLMSEFLQSGFYTIQKHLTERRAEIDECLLDAQKTHLEIFRSLLFTLGDLEYKKERRIEEVGANIQAAHIQQELCNDSLNPNAKKFSDAKRELLKLRDELDLELRDIRDRQAAALEQYKPTEEALCAANVQHTHPMADLDDRRLNTRAKMVEYKAMSLGHVSSVPVKNELESLKQSLHESRRIIASRSMNVSSGSNM